MIKKAFALFVVAMSVVFFVITQSMTDKSALPILALGDALRAEMHAAASGNYMGRALPMPKNVEQVCIVDQNTADTDHFLCQMKHFCTQWKNKEANIFFLPSGESLLIDGLFPEKTAACYPIIDGKFFFTLKQKDGKIIITYP